MSKTTDSISSTCVLCCQAIKTYAVGQCDHHICLKCSTKMRVLCEQKYCGVCRSDMPKVIFTQKLHPFQGIISHKFPMDRKYGIAFATSKVHEEYRRLQHHSCTICPSKRLPENSFRDLKDHMRKEHEMFFCELCIEHLQIFTHERKCYDRRNLALHKRKGDPDDTSYRGHPLCEFCDQRYFDNDELLKHLRRQHYFCHFCETDGASNQYYNDYDDLKYHFGEEHHLCEEDDCHAEKFTHAFRSEIDLKAHKAKVHSKNMTRAQVRQARQLDVEFALPPRPVRDNRGLGGSGRGRGRPRYERNNYDDTARAVEQSIFTASREVHIREEESRNEKRTRAIDKKAPSNSNEGRRGGSRPDTNSGKSSPVSWDSKDNTSAGGATTGGTSKKASKGSIDKGNQQKVVSSKVSDESISSRQTVAPVAKSKPVTADLVQQKLLQQAEMQRAETQRAETQRAEMQRVETQRAEMQRAETQRVETQRKAKVQEKKALEDFPSLATFKPLAYETIKPSWNTVESIPATTAPTTTTSTTTPSVLSKAGKKKKKKKDEANAQPAIVEQSAQPTWPKGGKTLKSATPSGGPPPGVSVYQKQPSFMPQPSSGGTWVPNKKSQAANGSSSKSRKGGAAWANKNSAPTLKPDEGNFPTLSLSSIASLLGSDPTTTNGNNKKGTKDNATISQKSKKSSPAVDEFAPTKTSGKSKKKENKSEKKNVPATDPRWLRNGDFVNSQPPVTSASGPPVSPPVSRAPVTHSSAVTGTHRPPPGIVAASTPVNNVTNRAPPPGFQPAPAIQSPPPGFGATSNANNFPPMDYVLPSNYTERNYTLLDKIKRYLDHDDGKLMIFKTVSGDFRRSNISPAEYYQHCQDLLGDNLSKIFSEMVSLLPDVVKQQELLEAHSDYRVRQTQTKQENRVLAISEHKPSTGGGRQGKTGGKAWGSSVEHSTCTQCGQVMLTADLDKHMNTHQDFPSLGSSVGGNKSKTVLAPPSWGARIK